MVYGQSVTLTATVSPATATGRVAFWDGTAQLGDAVLQANGSATVTTSTLWPGSDAITAVYSGDDDDATSTSSVLSETVVINGNSIIDVPDNTTLTLSGISGDGTLDKTGGGTLILTGQNTYTGGTDIEDGTLQLGDGTTDGSLVGDVTDSTALVFDDQAALTYAGVISGSGSVAQIGGGTLTLTGSNTYSGGTDIEGGTLRLGDGVANNGSVAGNIIDNAALAFANPGDQTYSGAISGSGGLTKDGAAR